ncbi:MAG: hypothetical protein AAGH67_03945 [Cyanobacteria bacterium P01_H01_bin.162]
MLQYFSHLNVETMTSLVCPMMIWAVMLVFFWSVMIAIKDGVAYIRKLHQIPCDRCLYYTGTHYLKCPVNPCIALSEAAIGCRDFEPMAKRQPQLRRPRSVTKKWCASQRE